MKTQTKTILVMISVLLVCLVVFSPRFTYAAAPNPGHVCSSIETNSSATADDCQGLKVVDPASPGTTYMEMFRTGSIWILADTKILAGHSLLVSGDSSFNSNILVGNTVYTDNVSAQGKIETRGNMYADNFTAFNDVCIPGKCLSTLSTGSSYSNGIGLDLTGTTFSVNSNYRLPQGCAPAQVPKFVGGAWICSADLNTGGSGGIATGSPGRLTKYNALGDNIADSALQETTVAGVPQLTTSSGTLVGIGAVSPQAELEVNGTIRVSSQSGPRYLDITPAYNPGFSFDYAQFRSNSKYFTFNKKMIIGSTTDSASMLYVTGTANVSSNFQVGGNTLMTGGLQVLQSTNTSGNLYVGQTANITGSLQVNQGINATGDICTGLAGGKCLSNAAGGGGPWQETVPTQVGLVTSTDTVGIGAAPSKNNKLHVKVTKM